MGIPSRIYCYFCATKLERRSDYSWYCPSCDYVQYESPKPATELILRRGGKILISQRGQEPDKGKFDMPGGFVEAQETIEQAALREAQEELGISQDDVLGIEYLTSFATYYPYGKEVYNVTVSVFVADLKEGVDVTPLDDVSAVRWIGAQDIDSVDWSRVHQRNNAQLVLGQK